ncbi:MAG: three-Cys-motif partner protein TcmP [Flavobacteriales bacterium]|mgnify:CR=1 FL=1|nr:three-Cys-motif partner protein TcmP [Flavobacteriales bacterium]
MGKKSQVDMLEHSKAKVELLKMYLVRYLNILSLTRFFTTIRIYDLFCGEGRYPNGGKGSPLVILDAVKSSLPVNEKSAAPSKFVCHFNDAKPEKAAKAEEAVTNEKYGFPEHLVKVRFTHEEYASIAPRVIDDIEASRDTRAFVFIDPYGYKHVSVNDIWQLLETGKAEVLLFLPISFMYRFGERATPDPLDKLLNDLIPSDARQFRDERDFIQKLKRGFEKKYGSDTFVEPFMIQKDAGTVYALFFFTRNELGMEKMLDVKWQIDKERGEGWTYEKRSLSNQLSMEFEPPPNPYAEAVWAYIQAGERTNSDMYLFTLDQRHLPKHTVEVLEHLQEDKLIVVEGPDGKPARRGAFYLNYKDHKGKVPDAKRITIRKV